MLKSPISYEEIDRMVQTLIDGLSPSEYRRFGARLNQIRRDLGKTNKYEILAEVI